MLNHVKLKKSRKNIQNGDIFIIKLDTEDFIIGRVLKGNIQESHDMINGTNLVVFFRETEKEIPDLERLSKKINEEKSKSFFVVPKGFWSKGIFKTVGNINLLEIEQKEIENYLFSYNNYGEKVINIHNQEIIEEEIKNRKIMPLGGYSIGFILSCLEKDLILKKTS